MNIEQLYEFCHSKKGVTEHFPFDEDTLVFKVGGKMFCLTSLKGWEAENPFLNLKCDPERAIILREEYESIQPGYHMSKLHWNSVYVKGDVTNKMLVELIEDSYELVFSSLTKKVRNEIHDLYNTVHRYFFSICRHLNPNKRKINFNFVLNVNLGFVWIYIIIKKIINDKIIKHTFN